MFSSSAASEFLGKRVYLMQEVDTVSNTIIDFSYVFTVIKNPEKSHGGYLEYIYSLCDDIQDINISHGLIADFISEEFALWKNGSSKYIEKPDIPETLDYAFDNLVDVCTKSTPDNIRENLTTFLKIYAIILDSGIVKCEQTDIVAILTCINTTSLIDRVNAELANNPNLSHISFTSVAMSILTKQIDASDADEELHDKIMSNMAEAISIVRTRGYGSLDEKVSVLTSYTQEYFKEFGIDLSNEMAKYNAEVFINHFAVGDTDVLPGDIEALLDNFRN
jgi:hypothetical protein